jgi:site-specific recombinase XerD
MIRNTQVIPLARRSSPEAQSSLALREAVQRYLDHALLEGLSPETRAWRDKKLTPLVAFLEEHGVVLVSDLTLEHARDYIRWRQRQTQRYPDHPCRSPVEGALSPATIAGDAQAFKSLASWLQSEHYRPDNVFAGLKKPKVPKTLKRPFNADELERLIEAIGTATAAAIRLLAMFLLCLDTGIRVSELVTAELTNFDPVKGELYVRGKGARDRRVPVGQTARRAILRYVRDHRPPAANPKLDFVFLTAEGLPLSRDAVEKMFDRLEQKSGIKISPHMLRRTFAVRFLVNGGDAFSLAKILGHSSLEVTKIYVELANTEIQAKHARCSPVDGLECLQHRRGRPRKLAPALAN